MILKSPKQLTPILTHEEILLLIGERARWCRKQQGLSRKELSQKSGVSVPTISRFETKGVTTLSVIVKIAAALGVLESLEPMFAAPEYKTIEELIKAESDD